MEGRWTPLDGTLVADCTTNIAGPFASLVLSDLGARVVKVEAPDGDASRHWPPSVDSQTTTYTALNRGKESVVLDARTPAGRRAIEELAARADVFLESMRPGKAEALGLGWEQLRHRNPALVYASVNAFGDTGPMSGLPGFDAIVQAYSGIMDLTGRPDGEPNRVGAAVIDVGTGMWTAIAVLGALLDRRAGGGGRRVQATMLGTAASFLAHHLASVRLAGVVPHRLGTAQHNFAPYECVRASDRPVMVGVNSEDMWRRFCEAVDDGRLAGDARFADNRGRVEHRGALVAQIEALTCGLTADELVGRLTAAGIPAAVVRGVADLAADPQLDALRLWGTTREGWPVTRIPVEGTREDVGPVASLGEHTAAVLAELGLAGERRP